MFVSAGMAKSRNDRWKAEQNEKLKLAAQRIWPVWARTLAEMIACRAEVPLRQAQGCPKCRRLYDVDLEALAMLRGRGWSLIGRRARCKASKCRASGRFVAAAGRDQPFILLMAEERMPDWLIGARPRDHEPPPPDPPLPPAPTEVDPVRWAYARDEKERKRLVRKARG